MEDDSDMSNSATVSWPSGSSEMASRIRDFDWSKTPIGPSERWPTALKVAVQLMLAFEYPTHICVGDGWTQLYNDSYATLIGFRHPDALGRDVRKTFAEVDFTSTLARVFNGETVTQTDQSYPFKRHGVLEPAWFDLSATPVRDEVDALVAILVIHKETTERVLLEHTRDELVARQAFLLKLSDDLRPLTGAVESQKTAMKLLVEYLGVMRATYFEVDAGQDWFTVTARYERNPVPIPDRMRLSDFAEGMSDAYRAGRTLVVSDTETEPQREAYRAIGVRAWVGVPLVREGRLLTVVGVHSTTARDWTPAELRLIEEVAERTWSAVERARTEEALRESEERFRRFVENVHEYAFVEVNPEGEITSWNPGAERLFGYSSAEVIRMPFSTLVAGDRAQGRAVQQELEDVARGAKREVAQWLTRRDGSRFWARWVSETIYDADGRIRGVAKVMRDETDRRDADLALRQSLADKEALLKEVHHRVKNNLQVITSLLNLQARDIEDERVLALFDETRNRVYSIAAIHDQLYRSTSFASIDIAEYARHLGPQLLRFYGVENRVQFNVQGEAVTLELERSVPCGLLLNELISNACKHAFPAGRSGKVTVSVLRESKTLRLTIEDDGVGFAAGFESERDSSLGMKLIRMLARQLGGDVQVIPGPGARVFVRFPAIRPDEERL